MKQILMSITFLTLGLSNQLIAQIVSIPDSIFKSKLLGFGIDTDFDNEISYQEAADVISLDLKAIDNPPPDYKYVDTIKTLKGIEAFINLEFLDCSYNKIDTIDLIANKILKNLKARNNEPLTCVKLNNNLLLEELELLENYNLSSIDLSSQINLKRLDISNTNISNPSLISNINLETLLCEQYISSTINISSLANLKTLNFTYSELTVLDISNNNKLRSLITNWSPLENIIVSENDSLIDISVNYGELKSLNLTGAPNVQRVSCVLNNLSSLNVAGLQELHTLNCGENELGVLNVSNNTSLFYLTCENNKITQLIFENNDSLKYLYCNNNNLSNFELSNAPNIVYIECANNLFSNLTVKHATLKHFFISENSQLNFLDITYAQGIRNLQLNNMSQPIKVCVWELPFPPVDSIYIIVGDIGSPNITFENCLDATHEVFEQFIKVYPNPASEVLQIELNKGIENEYNLFLYNSNGISVFEKKCDSTLNEINLAIESLPQGVYFLEISTKGHRYFKKVLIK